jgi:hypothetical protein
MFLAGHPNHQLVFMRLWQIDPAYLLGAFRDFYDESPLNITRILDVAQDLKVRPQSFHVQDCHLTCCRSWKIFWTHGPLPLLLTSLHWLLAEST